MTDRWERELGKLRTLEPRTDLWGVVARGPQHSSPPPSLRPRQRIIAGVVAIAVFAAAGAFAWKALRPNGVRPAITQGGTVPPLLIQVFDRRTAPDVIVTTEGSSSQGGARPGPTGRSPHVLDLTYGSVVGRWDPSTFREDRAGPDGVKREGLTFLFPDTEPALNAGARVQLSSQGATMHAVLIPIARQYSSEPIGPTIPLADGGFLPRAGHYLLQVRAVKAGDVEVWRGPVSIIPPGTFQLLWFNDGTGSHGEPVISMAVNGVQTKAGMLDATGIGKNGEEPTPYPLPDGIPTVGQTLAVASGTPIVMLDRSTRLGSSGTGNVQLSFGSPVPPYGRLGTIPLVGPERVIPARPGDYLFRVHVDTTYGANQHAFVGFLVCRIHVIAAPGT